jgi:hypothetical protein
VILDTQAAWRRHEYYVITTSTLTMKLAEVALQQQEALLARCKGKVHGTGMQLHTLLCAKLLCGHRTCS